MQGRREWLVGQCKITRIEELMGPLFEAKTFFPDYDRKAFDRHADWMFPHHFDPDTEKLVASMHSWLIQTPEYNILVDTCIGNDKDRMPYKDWHQMQSPWLTRLLGTGVMPEEIDFVMCTHLHVDHVGWNTRLVDGSWKPTFSNAKYVFSKAEFEHWQTERNKNAGETFAEVNNKTFDDSVLPILHLAEMLDGPGDIIENLLRINPAPGHTPGSITIELSSGKDAALFTGDILHHPIQVYEPHWNSAFCELPDQARDTRKKVLEHCSDKGCLMMPAHFGPSHAGKVKRSGEHFSFEFSDLTHRS